MTRFVVIIMPFRAITPPFAGLVIGVDARA